MSLFRPGSARAARLLVIAAALSIAGCAGTTVHEVASRPPTLSSLPPRSIGVVIEDESLPPEKPSRRARQAADLRTVSAALSERIPKLLASHRLAVVPAGQPPDLILRCRILALRSGSKALRVFVGYGAGKTVLQVGVTLADPAARDAPLLDFATHSTTGSMPGGGYGIPALVGEGLKALQKDGLAVEVDQTLQAIDSRVGAYFLSQGWPYPTLPQQGEP
ncbi:DUF4410 domain-containing protein [Azospirillum sp. HJ39]|uniref:DUF4410 domain-containing protein n=1 Tax=Azospirillum sp. HJ39 TaxID=3159496 RepID=UPI003555F4EB